MNCKLKLSFAITVLAILSGCATSRGVVEVTPQNSVASGPSNGKQVYIKAARDKRGFQANPSSPNIPSLDPSQSQNDTIKLRAVARKRNGFGKALGDILLKEDESVESLTTASVRQAFMEKGYKVLDKADQITPSTYVVDTDILQFWSWMNPGFWALTISTEIATDLTIKGNGMVERPTVQVKISDHYQTGAEGNYTEVMARALRAYVDELKLKLK